MASFVTSTIPLSNKEGNPVYGYTSHNYPKNGIFTIYIPADLPIDMVTLRERASCNSACPVRFENQIISPWDVTSRQSQIFESCLIKEKKGIQFRVCEFLPKPTTRCCTIEAFDKNLVSTDMTGSCIKILFVMPL
nr:hypothetical protein [Abalone asfa-like virus]